MRRMRSPCCARAVSGHAAADPTITLMKSRRRIAFTKAGTTPNRTRLQQGFTTGGMGSDHHFAWQQSARLNVRFGSKADMGLECALGPDRLRQSALPAKADIAECDWDVRFVPKADIALRLARG